MLAHENARRPVASRYDDEELAEKMLESIKGCSAHLHKTASTELDASESGGPARLTRVTRLKHARDDCYVLLRALTCRRSASFVQHFVLRIQASIACPAASGTTRLRARSEQRRAKTRCTCLGQRIFEYPVGHLLAGQRDYLSLVTHYKGLWEQAVKAGHMSAFPGANRAGSRHRILVQRVYRSP